MKVVINDDFIVLCLNRFYIKSIDFNDKEILQNYIKKLLLKLQDKYSLEFIGYYNITIYVDKNYGVIIEVKKEQLEYLDYFGSTLEINTRILEDSFLYEVSSVDFSDNYLIYTLNGKIYIRIKKIISNVQMGPILEKVNKIIYGKERKKITKKAKVLGW